MDHTSHCQRKVIKALKGVFLFLLIGLFIPQTQICHAQSAGDIDTLSQWRVDNTQAYSSGIFYDHFKYFIEGTIEVNSKVYYKVYKSGYNHWEMWGTPNYYDHVYCGALREEDNKWYTLDYLDEDILLYDFTMDVGDTVDSYATWGGFITVTDIDTIQVNGEAKKRLHLSCAGFGADYIIEDIGAFTGLFEPLMWFENGSFLFCYAIDFVPLWINPEFGWCDLTVSVEEPEEVNNVSIYPNPFTTSTTIEYELTEPSRVQLSIYNAIGEVVYQAVDRMMPQGKHNFTWTADRHPQGLYYAVLRGEEGVSVVKMLKQ